MAARSTASRHPHQLPKLLYYKNNPDTIANMNQPYPSSWPRPNKHRPDSVASRITDQQKQDLFNRVVTTRDLAKALNVHERYLSSLFPGKAPITNKKPLIEARKLFKLEVAKLVIAETYTLSQAAKVANVSYSTMRRFVQKAKTS